ncbi:MAG TPA: hypothetical protein VN213_12670, partial [Solirubrobacteraceae bacterium]|nr:hypothetical protein [Solirubrobacteraceae bacterium]
MEDAEHAAADVDGARLCAEAQRVEPAGGLVGVDLGLRDEVIEGGGAVAPARTGTRSRSRPWSAARAAVH